MLVSEPDGFGSCFVRCLPNTFMLMQGMQSFISEGKCNVGDDKYVGKQVYVGISPPARQGDCWIATSFVVGNSN